MRILFVKNKYYFDDGMKYIFNRLQQQLAGLEIVLQTEDICASYALDCAKLPYTHAIFWDKDVRLAKFLERSGVRCFNSSSTIELCDDKEKTYNAVSGLNINLPKTILNPLMFDASADTDTSFLQTVSKLGFPLIVKENTGSAGRQVFLAQDMQQLSALYSKLKYTPHMYQQFINGEIGQDIRVYTVGCKAVAAGVRSNTFSYKSNMSLGGTIKPIEITSQLKTMAELVANALNLDYGSVDFMQEGNKLFFIEANSNAYFKGIEQAGQNIAQPLSQYIARAIKNA